MATNVLGATRMGDVVVLENLIKSGFPVDIKDNNGWCALHEAANRNNLECMELLVAKDPTLINATSFDNTTPLLLCARKGHLECLKFLLGNGVDPNICDNMGESPLHAASTNGNADVATQLLKNNANVNLKNYNGSTPLHEAVEYNHPYILELLLEYEANINELDDNNLSPFFIAAYHGHTDCLATFLKMKSRTPDVVNTPMKDGCFPLFAATQSGKSDSVELLLASGALANIAAENLKSLPLHVAILKNHAEIIQTLLPVTSKEATYRCDFSPFHFAFRGDGDTTALSLLIQHGYDLSKQYSIWEQDCILLDYFYSLRSCTLSSLTESILMDVPSTYSDFILERQVFDFSVSVDGEFPPLLAAIYKDNLSLATRLLERGANINVYCHPYSFNLSLFATQSQRALEFVIRFGAEIDSLFSKNNVNVLVNVLNRARSNYKKHLELILIQSFYVSTKPNFPSELHHHLSSEYQSIISQLLEAGPRSLNELCRKAIRDHTKPSALLNNLEGLKEILPIHIINCLLNVTFLEIPPF